MRLLSIPSCRYIALCDRYLTIFAFDSILAGRFARKEEKDYIRNIDS